MRVVLLILLGCCLLRGAISLVDAQAEGHCTTILGRPSWSRLSDPPPSPPSNSSLTNGSTLVFANVDADLFSGPTTDEAYTFYASGGNITTICFYTVKCPRSFVLTLQATRGNGVVEVFPIEVPSGGNTLYRYAISSMNNNAGPTQQITSQQSATVKVTSRQWLGVTAKCAPANRETFCPFSADESLDGMPPQRFSPYPVRNWPSGLFCSWTISCPIGSEIELMYSSPSIVKVAASRFSNSLEQLYGSGKQLLGVRETRLSVEKNDWMVDTLEWSGYVSLRTECKLSIISMLLIVVGSLFAVFLIAVGIACCCMGDKSRARGKVRGVNVCCFGRWVWDLVLALLHLFESSASLMVITAVYTQKTADFLGTPTSTRPLFIAGITTFSLWLVVCPLIALIPCLRSSCAGCCSGGGGGHRTYVAPRRSNNNGKGGGGGIIILLLLATAPLWIWMGYNFAAACVASIYGEEDQERNEVEEEEDEDRRWAAALESWLRSQKAHAPYFVSCLGTIFLLVIEVLGLAVVQNSGNLVHPLQHLSIALKMVSLVCKGYCLCAGSLQFKAALFKYALVLFDIFSFLFALIALSEFFTQTASIADDDTTKSETPFSQFFLLLLGNWTSISVWWIRIFLLKISYIGLFGGVSQVVWWSFRADGQIKPICWLWSTFLTLPISVIACPLLECAKLSWLLLPLHKIEPEIKKCIIHLDTINLVESGIYTTDPLLETSTSKNDSRSKRLRLLINLHKAKIQSDLERGKRILRPFFPCFLVLSPYFLGHIFSCLFPILHMISSERSSNPYLIASSIVLFFTGVAAGCLSPSLIRYAEYCTLFCHNHLSRGDLFQIKFSLRTSLATPLDEDDVEFKQKARCGTVAIPQSEYSVQANQPVHLPTYSQRQWQDAWEFSSNNQRNHLRW